MPRKKQEGKEEKDEEELEINIDPEISMMQARFDMGCELDLEKLSKWLNSEEYNPEKFIGLRVEAGGSKVATIYSTGRGIITGCKNREEIKDVLDDLKEHMRIDEGEFEVNNITASDEIPYFIKLRKLSVSIGADYKPGRFPCAGWRDSETGAYMSISGGGSISVVGVEDKKELERAAENISRLLEKNPEALAKK